ncbi:MAG: hypothetical protein MI920_24225 [Kiloniellales bacterium]|nr:hypothetical protein [Kiloniellales bacterium]
MCPSHFPAIAAAAVVILTTTLPNPAVAEPMVLVHRESDRVTIGCPPYDDNPALIVQPKDTGKVRVLIDAFGMSALTKAATVEYEAKNYRGGQLKPSQVRIVIRGRLTGAAKALCDYLNTIY